MTSFDIISFAGTAIMSSYLTLCAIDEIGPNKDGGYSWVGYIFLAIESLIKRKVEHAPIVEEPPTENLNENILVV